MNHISPREVVVAARRVCTMICEQATRFNELDSRSGDGDMGSTLLVVARAVLAEASVEGADLGQTFGWLAQIVARTSGSSLSAVIMVGLVSLSRAMAGKSSSTAAEFIHSLEAALGDMQVRSRARLGDKTILDGLAAIVGEGKDASNFKVLGALAIAASTSAVERFRDRPSVIGRARLSDRKGVGLDDPGMVFLADAAAVLPA